MDLSRYTSPEVSSLIQAADALLAFCVIPLQRRFLAEAKAALEAELKSRLVAAKA